ncbi:UNVERIFIED_CONTAM: hypothetical protein Sradi_7049700 [Sesamum radiatum]|uniref:Reverse transcriptase domain-containing protein n=1 Tax=Sesamum radiatum TaxID=300843 RepID=A0AAW2J7D0_SESRA
MELSKLKNLKSVFRQRRKEKGDLASNVSLAKEFLEKAQALYEEHKEDILLLLVKCCRMVYCAAVKMEYMMLQQRAKLSWLKHGDQSSRVFFQKINSRRARQRVYQIHTPQGECITDMQRVTEEFISVFQNLLGGSRRQQNINLSWLRPDVKYLLSIEEGERLISSVTDEEIKEAFFDISEDSAPGPDGYSSLFYKAAWAVVGGEVCEAVKEFFVTGRLLKQINATTLTMIPKVQMPLQVSDYRPISCCNVIYKAITKVMVKRMQQILHLIIDQSQNAFVPGRSIADNILLAQELLAGYNQVKLPPRCTIKVDIQKAYDSVEWDFLLESLKLFKFPEKFIGWIEQCISTVMFSISLNGSLYGFFPSSRGLRQGDPISPYLFVIVMEVWRLLLHKRVQEAAAFQYHWKSQSARSEIVNVMGFQEGALPIKYLGVPLVSTKLSVADCRPLLQQIDARLAVIREIEGRMRRFLWRGSSMNGYAKVSWDQVCKSKQEGGLGIQRVLHLNQALLSRETHQHLFFDCPYSKRCLAILKENARFQWPKEDWNQGIMWASRKWRGKHLWHAGSRAALASIVYHVWTERNCRKFRSIATSAEVVTMRAMEDVRMRIISEGLPASLQAFSLYKVWKIPWHRSFF